MIAKEKNLKLMRGDSKIYTLRFQDKETKEAIDITDWKIYFTIKRRLNDSDDDALLKKDVSVHSDPENGTTQIQLNPSDTEDLLVGSFFYDIQLKRSATLIDTILIGDIQIYGDSTRRRS